MDAGIRWVRPPSELIRALGMYRKQVVIAIRAVALYVGVEMQNQARLGATWQDRTGNARSGLFFAVDGFGMQPVMGQVPASALAEKKDSARVSGSPEQLVIVLGHTVWYGKWLELAHGGKYAVVMSTIQNHLPMLEKMLKDVFRG